MSSDRRTSTHGDKRANIRTPRTQDALAYGRATADLRDALGRELNHRVLASPTTCPEGGTRRARNRVNVPGLAAVSQVIGGRKEPAYRYTPNEGCDAK
jgi:hypothetical protein